MATILLTPLMATVARWRALHGVSWFVKISDGLAGRGYRRPESVSGLRKEIGNLNHAKPARLENSLIRQVCDAIPRCESRGYAGMNPQHLNLEVYLAVLRP